METEGHGRPQKQEKVLQALRGGNTRRDAIVYAEIGVVTFYRWLQDDETFRNAVELAEAHPVINSVSGILSAGKKDWRALAWWLEHCPRTKEAWKRVEQLDLRQLTVDQLLALERACAEGVESAGDAGALEGEVAGPPALPE